jgi:hypothetical protein
LAFGEGKIFGVLGESTSSAKIPKYGVILVKIYAKIPKYGVIG